MKTSVKNLLGRSLFASRLDAVLLRNAAVVVAFHRIQEGDPTDALTIDTATFERHCRFYRRHFRVVPLRELVQRLERGDSVDRCLAITFDDGYRDNFENARPVLEKLSLPATFFVVSDWIGTDVVPRWDRVRGVRHPWMNWDQVRELHRRGFEVGAHTRNHVDLGSVSPGHAHDEVLGARLELERQLGAGVDSFAYPYGGRHHVTEANREVVRRSGFRCCCSLFGGINPAGTDPLFLNRVPISPWYASPHEFGFEVVTGRSIVPDIHAEKHR
ncbi:MAG TPA: polysaccharide deacetylase family protein [Vicinamibacterales bacterium]|nr:polysaccharide deacetylase family protein [Vicinamibacterales bacterium]